MPMRGIAAFSRTWTVGRARAWRRVRQRIDRRGGWMERGYGAGLDGPRHVGSGGTQGVAAGFNRRSVSRARK